MWRRLNKRLPEAWGERRTIQSKTQGFRPQRLDALASASLIFTRCTAFGFALVGGLHESENFDGFIGRDGSNARFKKFHDFDDKGNVAIE